MNLAAQLAALPKMDSAALTERYREVFGTEPRRRHSPWLRRKIAWELQARELGGLTPDAQRRLEALIAEIEGPLSPRLTAPLPRVRRPDLPAVGTVLTRMWHDQQIRVEVKPNGFLYADRLYGSLSAVAKAVTGQHWNGRLFWGLKTRRRQSKR